ncbi:transposase [Kitasatospora sp. A2-31]|uniref:transposase n=1 Tax=Kitasatospora sp. A2-31 TaxID=2916414 RepID=UPI001EEB55F8|nr:transposase [Kitasatospora sp. A2-31]MCG6495709.1 transposase [Kitasatospora sp. A2-31]
MSTPAGAVQVRTQAAAGNPLRRRLVPGPARYTYRPRHRRRNQHHHVPGTHTGHYRLLTTLTDPSAHPARELVRLYHERWEIKTAYAELKSTILGGRVLRAHIAAGIEQEVWALLVAYQALRTAITDATDSIAGTDPDQAGFTVALSAARDQLALAAGIIADTVIDLAGVIGRHVLAQLLPERRVRNRDRIVKRAISKYNARGSAIDRTT